MNINDSTGLVKRYFLLEMDNSLDAFSVLRGHSTWKHLDSC